MRLHGGRTPGRAPDHRAPARRRDGAARGGGVRGGAAVGRTPAATVGGISGRPYKLLLVITGAPLPCWRFQITVALRCDDRPLRAIVLGTGASRSGLADLNGSDTPPGSSLSPFSEVHCESRSPSAHEDTGGE